MYFKLLVDFEIRPHKEPMPDDLINELAAQIRAKEDAAAAAKQLQIHEVDFIKANCKAFFEGLKIALQNSGNQLNAALAGSASADPPVKFQALTAMEASLAKEDFPRASLNVSLNVNGLCINYALRTATSKLQDSGSLKFYMGEENSLCVKDDGSGEKFSAVQAIADHFMRLMFTV